MGIGTVFLVLVGMMYWGRYYDIFMPYLLYACNDTSADVQQVLA
jgi:hypothetical protein